MSGFRAMVEAQNQKIFLNTGHFAEMRKVKYDGVLYDGEKHTGIPVTLSRAKEEDRNPKVDDHLQGLHLVTVIMHCALADLEGVIPEQGGKIKVSDGEFFQAYYIAESGCEMGMVRLAMEAIAE